MKTRYIPPHKYTVAELRSADIADLESDVRCSREDAAKYPEKRAELFAYAEKCEAEITRLKALSQTNYIKEIRHTNPNFNPTY